MRVATTKWIRRSALAVLAWQALTAQAAITFQVGFDDPGALYTSYYDEIRANVLSAGYEWAFYLGTTHDVSLQVQVSFADIAQASGASFTNAYVGQVNGLATYEQGAAYQVTTGIDPNGAAPDINIMLGTSGYLQNQLWFDPSPMQQTAPVPADKTDARSIFLHELGHAFAFNGWRDGTTGALPDGYQSTFDALVTPGSFEGQSQLFFTGAKAMAVYGGPVPLTVGDYGHVGNAIVGDGLEALPDLMNGVQFVDGSRYHLSALDLAILEDTGISLTTDVVQPPPVPEPSTLALLLGGLGGLAWRRRCSHTSAAVAQNRMRKPNCGYCVSA